VSPEFFINGWRPEWEKITVTTSGWLSGGIEDILIPSTILLCKFVL
jgi:hypothetical protein